MDIRYRSRLSRETPHRPARTAIAAPDRVDDGTIGSAPLKYPRAREQAAENICRPFFRPFEGRLRINCWTHRGKSHQPETQPCAVVWRGRLTLQLRLVSCARSRAL